jgi:hypothetical protein
LTQRQACLFVERPDAIDEECRIEPADVVRDLLTREPLSWMRPQHHPHVDRFERARSGSVTAIGGRNLCQREEDRIGRRPPQIFTAQVTNDTDDRDVELRPLCPRDATPDWTRVAKRSSRQRLIHDGDASRMCGV